MYVKTIGVEDWLNVYEKSAEVDIAQSTIASLTLDELMAFSEDNGEGFWRDLKQEKQNYGWIEGSPTFKSEVAKLYNKIPADHILQTNGATGANLLALMNLVEPKDHVVAEYPTYQPLYEIPAMLGAKVDKWQIQEDLGWKPAIEDLRNLVTDETKLICINNASNPLGTVLDTETLQEIVNIAQEHNCWIVSDEVYLPLQNTEDFTSIADLYDKAVVTNSLSKTYSVPGIRMGWFATQNAELTEKCRTWRDYTMICGGVFNDALASYVLQHRDAILERNRAIIFENMAIVEDWLKTEPKASWCAPQGVSTAYVRFDINMNDEDFCLKLLKDYGTLMVPGSRFDLPCGARLGYCTNKATLIEGLKRLSYCLAEVN